VTDLDYTIEALSMSVVRLDKLRGMAKPGDIINSVSGPKWYEVWLKVVFGFIQRYQRRKHGKNSRWKSVHSTLYIDDGVVFSFEFPNALLLFLRKILGRDKAALKRGTFKEFKVSKRSKYIVIRPLHANLEDKVFPHDETQLMYEYAYKLLGQKYDYGQLIDILLKQLFSSFLKDKATIFDLGSKKKVCSVAVHWILMGIWILPLLIIYRSPTLPKTNNRQ